MEKSALQIARAAYQPKLPRALQGPVKAVEGEATQSVGNKDDIKALFPNTSGMPSSHSKLARRRSFRLSMLV